MGTFKQTFLINSAMDIENGERPYGLSEKEISLFSDRGLDPAREYELLVKFLKSRKRLNPVEQVTDDIREPRQYIRFKEQRDYQNGY